MTQRRWLVLVSLVVHVGLAIGLFASGVWRIERLDPEHRGLASLAVMMPPPAPEGGPTSSFNPKLVPKVKKRIVKDVQLPPKETAPQVAETTAPAGTGEGSGTGTGSGASTDTGICTENCGDGPPAVAVCGNGAREDGESCDDGNRTSGDGCSATCTAEAPRPRGPTTVSPTVMSSIRISGDTQVHPPDTTKTMMMRDGTSRTVGVLKVCVDTAGQVSSAGMAASTKYPDYDARLVSAVRDWRYRPYQVDGQPVAVCGMVTFIYSIK